MTISADLAIIKSQNADILAYLKVMAYQQSPSCCLPANTIMPELPAIPLLPPALPNVPQTAIDSELCKRIQKEIDNICTTWAQVIDIGTLTGTVTVAAAAAVIGLALAPESGGLSAIALAGFAAGVTTLIGMAGAEVGVISNTIRQDAAKAAYAAKDGGSFAATAAMLNVLKTDFPSPESANIFAGLVSLFGGLKRAFGTDDIGDYSGYSIICLAGTSIGHTDNIVFGTPVQERIYRWPAPIAMSNFIPNVNTPTEPARYFRDLPDGTIFINNSAATVTLNVWNAAGTLIINDNVPPNGIVNINNCNGGYAATPTTITVPAGELVFNLPL